MRSFYYFYCPSCEWDFVGDESDTAKRHYCPLCAEDNGRDVLLKMRQARNDDKPEGKDARIEP